MALGIRQSFTYAGDDWWDWAVWIGGPDAELDQVAYVRYTLHPTFPKPVRTVCDRASKFRLETGGWGTFRLHALVVRKDKTRLELHHDLELLYEDGKPTTA